MSIVIYICYINDMSYVNDMTHISYISYWNCTS